MKKDYLIELAGCHDTTEFIIKLSEAQYKTIKKIADISEKESYCSCMPILRISECKINQDVTSH